MSYFWLCASFNFYLIGLNSKYLPGDVFDNVIAISVTDVVSNLAAGFILGKINLRYSICFVSIITFVGGLLIASAPQTTQMMPFFIILIRTGANGLFAICYVATASMFPTLFSASAFGICNVAARTFTIFAPQVAEMAAPYPMMILSLLSIFASVLAF